MCGSNGMPMRVSDEARTTFLILSLRQAFVKSVVDRDKSILVHTFEDVVCAHGVCAELTAGVGLAR